MIKVICVGKLKEKYLKDLVEDYKKRIGKYHKIELIEIPDSNILEEQEKILKHINSEYVISLDIKGNMCDSVELSQKIDDLFTFGKSNIIFIIGGSTGLGQKVLERSDEKISFSKLIFPHGLFRGILLEQIYRSFKIINNEKYHK